MQRDIYVHKQVEVSYPLARDILRDDPVLLFSPSDHGETLSVDLQASIGPVHLARPVAIGFGAFREPLDGLCYRDLSWEADRGREFYPVMEGELELSELASNRVQISLIGRYRPPFSVVGAAIDAAVLHRVAEASVEILVGDAAKVLELASTDEQRPSVSR